LFYFFFLQLQQIENFKKCKSIKMQHENKQNPQNLKVTITLDKKWLKL
jgi:hypothetical protein